MSLSPPKCAVNMEQRLAALRRDQEIDGLRVYLIKYNLFPRNRDPNNSPIRIEELKELVKHWKLHRQRGFWRDHPEKDDLVRALLQHIKSEAANKKRRQEAQEKYRRASMAVDESALPKKDLATIFVTTESAALSAKRQQTQQAQKSIGTKHFGGDLFYTRGEYNEGMIYLSRVDKNHMQNTASILHSRPTVRHLPEDHRAQSGSNQHASAGGNRGDITSSGGDPNASTSGFQYHLEEPTAADDPESQELAREMKLRCAEGMYHVSCHKDQELRLIKEGCLRTLTTLIKIEDPLVRMFCAVTLLNLAANRHVQLKMIEDGAGALLLDLAHTTHIQVKHYCAWALFRFSSDEAHHLRMIHDGSVATLSQLMSLNNDAIKVNCMGALLNLASSPRATASDTILNTIVYLSKNATSVAPQASSRTTNASGPISRSSAEDQSDASASGKVEEDETLRMCARGLLNLSILPATRCNIIEEGAMVALSLLLKRPGLFEMISCVLCNLASIKTNQSHMVKNGALTMLVNIIDELEELPKLPQPATPVAPASARVTSAREGDQPQTQAPPATPKTPETSGATTEPAQATTGGPTPKASAREDPTYAAELARRLTIRRNCAHTLAHLCCNAKLHSRIVGAGFVPRLLKLMQSHHEETDRFCILCLANLSVDDRSRSTIVLAGVVPELLRILMDPAPPTPTDGVADASHEAVVLKKLDCVTALSNLMLHPKNFEQMAHDGVIPTLMKLTEQEDIPAIQKASVCALRNLAKDPAMKLRLAEQGALSTMISFALKYVKDTELCCICLSFLNHLATRSENVPLLFQEGALSLVTRLLQKPLATGNTMKKECVMLYALWHEAIATLNSMALNEQEHQVIIEEGALEALKHFLSVTSSDLRHMDKKTYNKRVRAYFVTSLLLLKMHQLACVADNVSVFYGCVLLLISASCANRSNHVDQESSQLHNKTIFVCVETVAKITLIARAHRILARHADIAPSLNSVMRTGLHEAQVFAAIALCNLATERGQLPNRVWRDNTVEDFIVITLLRVNSVDTKELCAKALFNLLTHEDTRDQMIKDGCLYALLKLSRLDNESIRDLCFRSLYNISLDANKVPMLLQMEIVRVLSKMYQGEYSKDMKRLLSGILSNVSSVCSGHESQLIHEGLLTLLKHLVKVRDPETKVYAANGLSNVSCNVEVAELLVRDEAGVLSMLDGNLKSDSKELRKYAAMTLANLSSHPLAVDFIAKENLVGVINDTLKRTMGTCVVTCFNSVFTIRNLFANQVNQQAFVDHGGVKTLASLLSCAELEKEVETLLICSELLCALANLDQDKDKDATSRMEEKLVQDGIIKALFFIARNSKKFEKPPPSTPGGPLASSSSSFASASASTASPGVQAAAPSTAMSVAAAKAAADTAPTVKGSGMNIVISLSNLSRNTACHEQMIKDGILDAICFLCHAESPDEVKVVMKSLVASMGESFCHHCAVTLRNLSLKPVSAPPPGYAPKPGAVVDPDADQPQQPQQQQPKAPNRAQRFGALTGLVPILLALTQSINAETREHAVVTINNIVCNKRCCSTLIRSDGVKILLKLSASATPFVKHMCTLALQVLATHDDANVLQDGLVTSITGLNELNTELVTSAVKRASMIVYATMAPSASTTGSTSAMAAPSMASSGSSGLAAASAPSSSSKAKEWTLIVSQNQPVRHKGAPADWQRVNIPTLPKFPSLSDAIEEDSGGSDDEFGGSHEIVSVVPPQDPVPVTPPSSTKRTSIAGSGKTLVSAAGGHLQHGSAGTMAVSTTSASPPKPSTTSGSPSGKSGSPTDAASSSANAITIPRPCNSDVVLGSLEMIHDVRMDKVRIPPQLLEVEMATFAAHRHRHHLNSIVGASAALPSHPQRAQSQLQLPGAGGPTAGEELPKISRPVTAPDAIVGGVEMEGAGCAEPGSTLKQARQQAEAHVQSSASSPVNVVRSPHGGQRKSRNLEPLAS